MVGCSAPTQPAPPTVPNTGAAAPTVISPQDGTLIGDLDQPVTLVVQNHVTAQPIAATSYGFDIATDTDFDNIIVSKNLSGIEGEQASVTLDALPPNATYY